MEIILALTGNPGVQSLSVLKNFIEEASIEEVESVEIARLPNTDGSLGVGDLLDSISLIIKAATKPLTELASALRDYVKTFRTSVNIILPNGTTIIIDKGKNTTADEIVKMIEAAKK